MGKQLDIEKAKRLLNEQYEQAVRDYLHGTPPLVSERAEKAADKLFETEVQSYREALLGCAIARVLDPQIDLALPYADLGDNAFSGRTLDEHVINPFLVSQDIPCSRGPYLAVFRRHISFTPDIARGLKDKQGYQAFLEYLNELKQADDKTAFQLLRYLLYRFVKLRERSGVKLARLPRISLSQVQRLTDALLSRPTGGLMPVLLTVALLKALSETYQLGWRVEWQKINVADRASGVGGDITVREGDQLRLVIEVTEREIDRARVEATFRSKLTRFDIQDYLFVFKEAPPAEEAHQLGHQFFAQGYEIGFARVSDWIYYNLATAGAKGRAFFLREIVNLLEDTPAAVKMIWNQVVQQLLQTQNS